MKINKNLVFVTIIILFVLLYCGGVINFPSGENASKSSLSPSAQNSQNQKINDYTAEELAEAVQLGKDNKFDTTKIFNNYLIGYSLGNYGKGYIGISTPYLSLFFDSASAAKEYKELSSEKINSYLNNNGLGISATAYGDSYDFGDDLSAVIKMNGQVIHPVKAELSKNVDTTSFWPESPKYSSINYFYFSDFSSFKGKQFQFVLIKPDGESVYEVDMNNYK
jgi:hypothetical protein